MPQTTQLTTSRSKSRPIGSLNNMDFITTKTLMIAVLILLVAGIWLLGGSNGKQGAGGVGDTEAQEIGADVLKLNASLQSVTLDQSIFDYSLYKNLQDFSVTLSSQPVGRNNPFDVIGRDKPGWAY